MNNIIDLNLFSKFIMTGIIAALTIYMLIGVSSMSAGDSSVQSEKMRTIIEKALTQCYALEGSYPSVNQFEEKMNRYGVVLNHDKYIFHYDSFSTNIMPDIIVVPKP